MDAADIDRTLTACETALGRPGRVDLTALGFWKAVSAAKRDRGLVERYGERIARIDRDAFLRRAPIHMPAVIGFAIEVIGTMFVLGIVLAAPRFPVPWREIVLVAGGGALIGLTHGLAHVLVGSAMGIRFTDFYSLPPLKPQPGFKTDYATYLRTPARSRAWMHASGAIVSKIVPFAVAAIAASAGAAAWAVWVLLAIGVVQLITDVTLSTRASDWKKFKREMRFAG
jgi:hypothetical protein